MLISHLISTIKLIEYHYPIKKSYYDARFLITKKIYALLMADMWFHPEIAYHSFLEEYR